MKFEQRCRQTLTPASPKTMDVHDVLDTQPEESVPDAAADEQPEQPEEAEPAPLTFHEVRLLRLLHCPRGAR